MQHVHPQPILFFQWHTFCEHEIHSKDEAEDEKQEAPEYVWISTRVAAWDIAAGVVKDGQAVATNAGTFYTSMTVAIVVINHGTNDT